MLPPVEGLGLSEAGLVLLLVLPLGFLLVLLSVESQVLVGVLESGLPLVLR